MTPRYIRFAELKARNIVSNRMTLSRWIKAGRFPKPVHLGPNTTAWASDEVDAFEARIRAEREGRAAA
jgi:predicted DNA-binding transcriptional regulator AlpA